ncbi:Calcium-activated BK potassium channel alpha subunit [Phytophthora infestans]|uniref:Calcium-activated BK potassium channel alpha subunit n=1 Tax=Phytophthora infestans TaxID=4787 RepID=A0A833VU45_PHYIN|nr:Calcium-activated BK potassium channel alpha subunit [Phytophthora infestans]
MRAAMPHYLEVATPDGGRDMAELREAMKTSGRAHEDSIQVADSPNKYESASRFDVKISSVRSDNLGKRAEVGRSVAQIYVPTLQERAHTMLAGSYGLALELVNFALSMLIFLAYIAELYDQDIYYSHSRFAVEVVATSFFIFDFGLHLFVANDPWKYVFSGHGMIDLVTIIPSLIVFVDPGTRSNLMFVFRVLRIFRILRVLRLARYIKFKKHGFEYELGVFIFSTIAVILCAAGIYQALESDGYDEDDKLEFHDSLYFVLVTLTTCYGDVTPRTLLGHVFVIVAIIAIFTIVPAEVNKLNALAKLSKPWDKEVTVKASGHVIVSGYNLSAITVLEFLQEFYHPSRGSIHLDVVFISDEPPSPELLCTKNELFTRKFNEGTGSVSSEDGICDRCLFLANNRNEPAKQDAATILHAVSIRNYADTCGKHVDIYVQLLSRVHEYEMLSALLGANATKTSALKDMLLARAAVCPGSSTLILNLIRSYHVGQYTKRRVWSKGWIHEYLDGLTYQIFPIMFSSRFDDRKFGSVARHMYEKYGALLFSIFSRNCSADEGTHGGTVYLAPFGTLISEGDIGFVIAKSASDVIRIVNSYGYWESESEEDLRSSASMLTSPVRISSDSLWRRSPRHSFHPVMKSASVRNIRLELGDQDEYGLWGDSAASISDTLTKNCDVLAAALTSDTKISAPPPIERAQSTPSVTKASLKTRSLHAAIRSKDVDRIEAAFQRDHLRSNVKGQSGHYVICSRSLSDAVSISKLLRRYTQHERQMTHVGFTEDAQIVFLLAYRPTVKDLMMVAEQHSADLLRDMILVVGSPARINDLLRVEASKARQVVILPLDKSVSREPDQLTSSYEVSEFGLSGQNTLLDDERLADFGVVCSLLAIEHISQGASRPVSPRIHRGKSSRLESDAETSPTAHTSFKRELEQGIPLESVKLRALGRFPGLDPGIFREKSDIIDGVLQQFDTQVMKAERKITAAGSRSATGNTLSVLHYACNAKLCRPCDEAVQDEFPSLTPSFAGGNIFLSSLLNRIVCQAFYNPYIMEVVVALANGSGSLTFSKYGDDSPNVGNNTESSHRRLFEEEINDEFVGGAFMDVFLNYISREMLVIGVMRSTCLELDNLLPFVYTCPPSSLIMHSKDRLFVLG